MAETCGAWRDSIQRWALVGRFRVGEVSYGVLLMPIDFGMVFFFSQTGACYKIVIRFIVEVVVGVCVFCCFSIFFFRVPGSFLTTGTCVYGGQLEWFSGSAHTSYPSMNVSVFR